MRNKTKNKGRKKIKSLIEYVISACGGILFIYLGIRIHPLLAVYSLIFLIPLFLEFYEIFKTYRIKQEEKAMRELWKKVEEKAIREFEKMRERCKEICKPIRWEEREFPEIKIETTGEILKKLGIRRVKIRKKPKKREIELKPVKKRKEKISALAPLLYELLDKGELKISKNMHYGKLRGKDIAKALAKELRRRNIDFDLKLDDYDARIKIKE